MEYGDNYNSIGKVEYVINKQCILIQHKANCISSLFVAEADNKCNLWKLVW